MYLYKSSINILKENDRIHHFAALNELINLGIAHHWLTEREANKLYVSWHKNTLSPVISQRDKTQGNQMFGSSSQVAEYTDGRVFGIAPCV